MADGDGRGAINLAEDVFLAESAGAKTPLDREALVAARAAPRAALRQEPGRPLQSDQRAAQIGARLGPRRRALLARAHARGRRGPALYRAAAGAHGGRGYRARRSRTRWCRPIAAKDTYDFLGSPEGELALAQATIYLATAPKSNAGYVAFGAAQRAAEESGSLLPPKHILNAPTKLMKQEGYGRATPTTITRTEAFSGQNYFPDGMERQMFYAPTSPTATRPS